MREYYSIQSREEADRFSEAYLDAQREYHEHLDEMYENGYEAGKKDATHCRETECNACVLKPLCHNGDIDTIGDSSPYFWPDPEEGG